MTFDAAEGSGYSLVEKVDIGRHDRRDSAGEDRERQCSVLCVFFMERSAAADQQDSLLQWVVEMVCRGVQ